MRQFFTIIGGMGTMATESYLHLLNKRTPAHADQEYLNYLMVNHATVPDRTTYLLDNTKTNFEPDLLEDIKDQSTLNPDFFVIACNTAHYFYDDLQAATTIPILHMPRETVAEIKRLYPNAKRIGITGTKGTVTDGIYDREIEAAGLNPVKPSDAIQARTNQLIYDDIKNEDYVDPKLFHGIVHDMINQMACDVVILGCTELSLAQEREPIDDTPVMDSQSILVDRSIEQAVKTQKRNWA